MGTDSLLKPHSSRAVFSTFVLASFFNPWGYQETEAVGYRLLYRFTEFHIIKCSVITKLWSYKEVINGQTTRRGEDKGAEKTQEAVGCHKYEK